MPDGAMLPAQAEPAALADQFAPWAEQAAALMAAQHGATALPPPVLPHANTRLVWRNWLFTAPGMRRGHVELFQVPHNFAVLHICVMPGLARPDPIFGLDIIAGRNVASGVFLDLSPGGAAVPATLRAGLAALPPCALGTPRPRPAWGDFFSADFLCVQPQGPDAASRGFAHGMAVLQACLRHLATQPAGAACAEARRAQAEYCAGQRENQHTRRMLAGFVGPEAAGRFMADVLFPLPA